MAKEIKINKRLIIDGKEQGCDLLKIHYLCGDKDNHHPKHPITAVVVICSKFITFAVTKTTKWQNHSRTVELWFAQNSLPLRWQRQRGQTCSFLPIRLWFAQNSLPLRWQRQLLTLTRRMPSCCDLLKIHYLCGDKDNRTMLHLSVEVVVICSKFITFAVTKTTLDREIKSKRWLWFAQNSLPLRWQRQLRALF